MIITSILLEQVKVVETSFSDWKSDVLAVVRHLHIFGRERLPVHFSKATVRFELTTSAYPCEIRCAA